jgi:hypothetical protein
MTLTDKLTDKERKLLAKGYLWFLAFLVFCGYVALWIFALGFAVLVTVVVLTCVAGLLFILAIEEVFK